MVPCIVVSYRRAALRRRDRIVVLSGVYATAICTLEELLRTSAETRRLGQGEQDDRAAPVVRKGRG